MKVFIPAAGLGSRLGDETRFLSKAMVAVGNRPVISHIVERFPIETTFVIAIGFGGQVVRDFLVSVYPERSFEFVFISPYEGPDSGLGLTLLQSRHLLQCPFLFWPCDTLCNFPLSFGQQNWILLNQENDFTDFSLYRTAQVNAEGRVTSINEKGSNSDHSHAYTGIAYIADFKCFWSEMENGGLTAVEQGEVYALREMLINYDLSASFVSDWLDTGSPTGLKAARENLSRDMDISLLPKSNEAIWFVRDWVIKYSSDEKAVSDRVERVKYLLGYVPQVKRLGKNLYAYDFVEGRALSRSVTKQDALNFFTWIKEFLKPIALVDTIEFMAACRQFYFDKTYQRANLFFKRFSETDKIQIINGKRVAKLEELLQRVDWTWICDGLPARFHGDLHFENVLVCKDQRFLLLDWRQDFAGLLNVGDLYYDLAKIFHGLIINHELIEQNQYEYRNESDNVTFRFSRKPEMIEIETEFRRFVQINGWQWEKVEFITALIFINIAALHHDPYSHLLMSLGRSMLHENLERRSESTPGAPANS